MSSDKQIEEMYKDVYEAINHNRVIDVTHDCYIDVNTIGLTKELYDDGYRKASEVAREIFEEIDKIFRQQFEKCSENTELKLLEPLCQAERFVINEMWHEVAELKKKYTEER